MPSMALATKAAFVQDLEQICSALTYPLPRCAPVELRHRQKIFIT
jgi:hypothetical protein